MKKEELQAIINAAGIEYERPIEDGYHIYMEMWDGNGMLEPHGMYHLYDEDGSLLDIQTSRTVLNITNNHRPQKGKPVPQGPLKKGRKEGSARKTVTVPKRVVDPTMKAKPIVSPRASNQNAMRERAQAFLARKQYQCGSCGEMGHNARTCSKK